jgi:hypothetical protein
MGSRSALIGRKSLGLFAAKITGAAAIEVLRLIVNTIVPPIESSNFQAALCTCGFSCLCLFGSISFGYCDVRLRKKRVVVSGFLPYSSA